MYIYKYIYIYVYKYGYKNIDQTACFLLVACI